MTATASWLLRTPPTPVLQLVDAGASLGRDIRFDSNLVAAPGGDYAIVEQENALWQSIRCRLAAKPGEYKHDLTYGVGVASYLKKPDTPTRRSQLRQAIIANLSTDDRIQSVDDVTFTPFTTAAGQRGIRISIDVTVRSQKQRLAPFIFTEAA